MVLGYDALAGLEENWSGFQNQLGVQIVTEQLCQKQYCFSQYFLKVPALLLGCLQRGKTDLLHGCLC